MRSISSNDIILGFFRFLKIFEESTIIMPTFAYCNCFLRQNIFIRQIQRHLQYLNEHQFKTDYEKILSSNFEQVLNLVKKEILRRINLRENVLQRIGNVCDYYKPLHPGIFKVIEFTP